MRRAWLLPLALAILWSAAAVWFDGPRLRWLAGTLALAVPVACAVALWRVRPLWRAGLISTFVFLIVYAWWLLIPARNDRDWLPDVANPASAKYDGSLVTIQNIRNFEYRSETDFTPHWETRTYDMNKIVGVDLFLSYWGPTLIAHTIASWEFADGQHLAISIETRKEKGESYSAVLGFFRQYELYYVVADERDVVGMRAQHRGEQLFLYRINADQARATALLGDYLKSVNKLAKRPKWYNALTDNCTTTIRYHYKNVAPVQQFSWKILANGCLDELLYERGGIDKSLPFAELRKRSDVTAKAKEAGISTEFSTLIREGLPGMKKQ